MTVKIGSTVIEVLRQLGPPERAEHADLNITTKDRRGQHLRVGVSAMVFHYPEADIWLGRDGRVILWNDPKGSLYCQTPVPWTRKTFSQGCPAVDVLRLQRSATKNVAITESGFGENGRGGFFLDLDEHNTVFFNPEGLVYDWASSSPGPSPLRTRRRTKKRTEV